MVTSHTWRDYPTRGFSAGEVLNLVMYGKATLVLNRGTNPTPGSFHFMPKDDFDRTCKLVVKFDKDATGELIVVISAFREV